MSNVIIDEEIKEEVKVEDTPLDEYEASAQHLNIIFNQFRKYGYDLAKRKKKAPIRILEAFLFEGLHDVELIGEDEKEMLDLCRQVVYHKNKLVEYVVKQKESKGDLNE